jgi:rubrerythrin
LKFGAFVAQYPPLITSEEETMGRSFSIRELVEYALRQEVFARRIYERLALKSPQDETRLLLSQLAGFEADHIMDFAAALEKEIRREGINLRALLEGGNQDPIEVPEGINEQLLASASIEDILKRAKAMEKAMSAFYRDLSMQAVSERITQAADKLAGEELEHLEILRRIEGILRLNLNAAQGDVHAP